MAQDGAGCHAVITALSHPSVILYGNGCVYLSDRPTGAAGMKIWEAQIMPFAKSAISGSEDFCDMASDTPGPEAVAASQRAVNALPLASVGTFFSSYGLRSGPHGFG